MTATASNHVPTIIDWLWLLAIIAGFAILAVMAIRTADREERELLELDDVDDALPAPIEIAPFRIVDPPPYNWQDDETAS